jgi:hypothetical protein
MKKNKAPESLTLSGSIPITGGNITITNGSLISDYGSTITTYIYNQPKYISTELIDTIILEDKIELVYKGYLYNPYLITSKTQSIEIWKDIYGCVDGKFGKIETILGEHLPATKESYIFDK